MHRRSFLQAGAAASLLGTFPRFSFAQQPAYDPRPAGWRTFEVTTHVEILKPTGTSRVWVVSWVVLLVTVRSSRCSRVRCAGCRQRATLSARGR